MISLIDNVFKTFSVVPFSKYKTPTRKTCVKKKKKQTPAEFRFFFSIVNLLRRYTYRCSTVSATTGACLECSKRNLLLAMYKHLWTNWSHSSIFSLGAFFFFLLLFFFSLTHFTVARVEFRNRKAHRRWNNERNTSWRIDYNIRVRLNMNSTFRVRHTKY